MSVSLLPGIESLDPKSLCYSIYKQLYNHFFNAQDRKDEQHPWGIVEGDELSIRLKNAAYGFAEAIAGGVNGEGSSGTGGILLDYLKKQGDTMQGKFSANYGFEAGIENHRIIQTGWKEYRDSEGHLIEKRYNVQIDGDLDIGSDKLIIGGRNFIRFDNNLDCAIIEYDRLNFGKSNIISNGIFEYSKDNNTVVIDAPFIWINGKMVFHEGNANTPNTDWIMKNARIEADMYVGGKTYLKGFLSASNGVELGNYGNCYLYTDNQQINILKDLNFETVNGIKMQDYPVLSAISLTDIELSAVYGDLFLGLNNTNKVILGANLSDIDGQYVLISKFGSAYFPESLTVRHNFGDVLLSTYRKDWSDEGVVIHKRLRFGDKTGPWIECQGASVVYSSHMIDYDQNNERLLYTYSTGLEYLRSDSYYRSKDQLAHSLFITTDADSFNFNQPVESRTSLGIVSSPTKLTDGELFLSEENFLLSTAAGVKYYGHAYMMSGISSERFASGFAGYGWAITPNLTTGNVAATFDELTVRKKMRIYELEVQKITATNGSLWVSDNCSGDTVVKL